MSRTDSTIAPKDPTASPEQVRQLLLNRHVCPYCGNTSSGGTEACARCTMEDSPATRQATKARIGPWYVLQTRNPSAPGMKFITLMSLLRKGYITPKSVLRGPTTYQLWRFAANVRGVSREFGVCYSCGSAIVKTASYCPSCQRSQEPPGDPDVLIEPRHANSRVHTAVTAVVEPVPIVVHPPIVQTNITQTTAIEPAPSGSYARRLRELNRRSQGSSRRADDSNLPVRASTPVVFSGDERNVNAMSLAQALQSKAPNDLLVPSRRRLKILLATAAVIVVGATILFYVRPDVRQKSLAWTQETWTTVRTRVAAVEWPGSSKSPARPETRRPTPQRPSPARPDADRIASLETTPTAAPTVETPVGEPPVVARAPIASDSSAVELAEAPTPEPAAIDPEEFLPQVRLLWKNALDAESRDDFASAVQIYEQLRKLPADAWPGGLQLRLEQARARMQSTSAQ